MAAVLLIAAHEPALARYVGSANVALLPYASAYSVIRILALPAGIVSAVAQSAFLAVRDPWTPLKAVTLTTVLNLALDLWFVAGLGWGIAGAACGDERITSHHHGAPHPSARASRAGNRQG